MYYGSPPIVTNGLVLALDAGNTKSYTSGSTNWFSLGNPALSGSLVGGPTFSNQNGGSIVFDRTDDYAELGNILFNSASATTLDLWVNIPSMTVNRYIMAKGSGGDGIYTFYMTTGPGPSGGGSSYIRFTMGNQSGTVSTIIEYSSLVWGQWYNFTFTYNGSFVTGYRNAATPQSSSLTGNLYTTTSPIRLASDKYLAVGAANISSFKIYNRALSQAEITQNYNATKTRFGLS